MKRNRVFLIVVLWLFGTPLFQAEARYYDARTGRFLQIDPKAQKFAGWSPYNYALDNPLKYIDPDGNEVRIYSRWSGPGHRHLFLIVKNAETGIFTSRSLMPAGGKAEGIYTWLPFVKGDNTPVIKKDLDPDLGAVKRQEAGEKNVDAHCEMVVKPPDGTSEKDYDDAVLKAADKYDVAARPYDADDGPNSNTYVNDVIEGTGVKLPPFDSATAQKWSDDQKKKDKQNNEAEQTKRDNQGPNNGMQTL
jgi:uncharacterized protein RhaS with RHS repeats